MVVDVDAMEGNRDVWERIAEELIGEVVTAGFHPSDKQRVRIGYEDFIGFDMTFIGDVLVDGEEVDELGGEYRVEGITLANEYPGPPGTPKIRFSTQ